MSYVGYENKDEDAIFEQRTESLPLEIGGEFIITGWFVKDRTDKEGNRPHG